MTRSIIAVAFLGLCAVTASAQIDPGRPVDVNHLAKVGVIEDRFVSRIQEGGDRVDGSVTSVLTNAQLTADRNTTLAFKNARSDSPDLTNSDITGPASPAASSAPLSQEYRVGEGDVLDVQLTDMPTNKSTLFTVAKGGMLDYPLAGEPVSVTGLTADEIAVRLRTQIKVLEDPKVVVKVREYVSHSVTISGLVADPGAKALRREALPLYVVLVEAQPRAEATRATITRAGHSTITVDLMDHKSTATLVMPGDLVKVEGPPIETAGFFFAGGALNSPGQRAFVANLTLTQAILACGGVTRDAGRKIKISRQGVDGLLITSEYNLQQIQDGKAADPVLQRGDRITVPETR